MSGCRDDHTFEVGLGPLQVPEWHPYNLQCLVPLGDREPEVLMNGRALLFPTFERE